MMQRYGAVCRETNCGRDVVCVPRLIVRVVVLVVFIRCRACMFCSMPSNKIRCFCSVLSNKSGEFVEKDIADVYLFRTII